MFPVDSIAFGLISFIQLAQRPISWSSIRGLSMKIRMISLKWNLLHHATDPLPSYDTSRDLS